MVNIDDVLKEEDEKNMFNFLKKVLTTIIT